MLGEADIAAMFDHLDCVDGAVDVKVGTTTVKGLRDREAMEVLGEQMPGVIAGQDTVHVQSGALPGLAPGVTVTVDGKAYVAREVLPYGDGAMTKILLRTP